MGCLTVCGDANQQARSKPIVRHGVSDRSRLLTEPLAVADVDRFKQCKQEILQI
jgi:hypothetical protein